MPLRLLFYMCEILRDYSKNAKHKKYDKNLRIPAVIPLVLYNGDEKWAVPREFRKIIYNEDLFGSGLLNFKYDLFDINNDYTKEQLINSKNVTAAIFLLDQKIDALEFLQRIKAIALFFQALSDTEMKAIKHWIKNTTPEQLADSAIKILDAKKEDVELMVASNAFILDEMKEKARKDGIGQGLKEGIEQGLEKGIEQGLTQGKNLGKAELLIKQLRKKFKSFPKDYEDKIITLPENILEIIAEEIFDIDNVEDLEKYFK